MDIAVDPISGDIVIAGGDLRLVDGVDAIAQHVAIRLQFFQGEWFLDQRIGVPYFQSVLVKNPDLTLVRFLLREAILTTPGIEGLDSFEVDFDPATRKLDVSLEARTVDGPLTFDRELIVG